MYIVFDYFFNHGFTIKKESIKVFDNINDVINLNIFSDKELDLLKCYWITESDQYLCMVLKYDDMINDIKIEMKYTNIELLVRLYNFNFNRYIREHKLKKINNESRNLF